MLDKHKLWVEKYRPKTIEEYIFQDGHQKQSFYKMLEYKSIPHLLLSGVQGSGKTTIAQILINGMDLDDSDILTINASRENSVDVVRDKIHTFVTTFAMGPFKVLHLEEADYISMAGQAVMRDIMEKYADHVRFILTCNYTNRIMPAIVSRCQHFHFKAADKNDIAEYCINILAHERVNFDLAVLDKYIAYGYPDIRKIVNTLQQNSIEGQLREPKQEGIAGDWKFDLIDLIERDRWNDARKLVCASVEGEEWVELYRFMYENLHRGPKFKDRTKWEEGILIIAKHLYQHGIVADAEINAASLFISLGQL
jgi:replication factor C small subunit